MPRTPRQPRLHQNLPYLAHIPADPTLKSQTISWLTVTAPCLAEKHKTEMIRSEIESNELMKPCRFAAHNTAQIYCYKKRNKIIYNFYVWTLKCFQHETRLVFFGCFCISISFNPSFPSALSCQQHDMSLGSTISMLFAYICFILLIAPHLLRFSAYN